MVDLRQTCWGWNKRFESGAAEFGTGQRRPSRVEEEAKGQKESEREVVEGRKTCLGLQKGIKDAQAFWSWRRRFRSAMDLRLAPAPVRRHACLR